MGQLIYENQINPTAGKTGFVIDLSNEATGYYLLHVNDSKNSKIEKVFAQ